MRKQRNEIVLSQNDYITTVNGTIRNFRKGQKLFLKYEPEALENDPGQDLLVFSESVMKRSARVLYQLLSLEDRQGLFEELASLFPYKSSVENGMTNEEYRKRFDGQLEDPDKFEWALKIAVNYGIEFYLAELNIVKGIMRWEVERD